MKKTLLLAATAFAVAAMPANAAVVVDFDESGTPPSDVTVYQDGTGISDGTPIGTNAFAYTDSRENVAARPAFGSTGAFGAVLAGGSFTTNLPRAASRFGFTLGSLDQYNTLTLRFADGTSQVFSGAGITAGGQANGNQISGATNGFVTFRSDGSRIVGADFASSENSFEFDNLAVGGVPEPMTWSMMILGFGVVGGAIRRRRSVSTAVRFA